MDEGDVRGLPAGPRRAGETGRIPVRAAPPRRRGACRARVLALLPCCAVLAGCADQLVGKWKTVEGESEESKSRMTMMTFRADHTFTARGSFDGKNTPLAGTWNYAWGKLHLHAMGGKKQECDATVWWGKRLVITTSEDDKKVTHRFERVEEQPARPGLFERDPSRS